MHFVDFKRLLAVRHTGDSLRSTARYIQISMFLVGYVFLLQDLHADTFSTRNCPSISVGSIQDLQLMLILSTGTNGQTQRRDDHAPPFQQRYEQKKRHHANALRWNSGLAKRAPIATSPPVCRYAREADQTRQVQAPRVA